MLTLRVRARSGREFEEEFLGKAGKGVVFVRRLDKRKALDLAVSGNGELKSKMASMLFSFVVKYLRVHGVFGEVRFCRSVDTQADAHGADAIFALTIGERTYFVTIDLFFISDEEVINMIARRHKDRFDCLRDSPLYMRWAAKDILLRDYRTYQEDLFRLKRNIREHSNIDPDSSHFILIPGDITGGRRLRALGREIALSLYKQVKSSPP